MGAVGAAGGQTWLAGGSWARGRELRKPLTTWEFRRGLGASPPASPWPDPLAFEEMAPRGGLEPPTKRLTAAYSTVELSGSVKGRGTGGRIGRARPKVKPEFGFARSQGTSATFTQPPARDAKRRYASAPLSSGTRCVKTAARSAARRRASETSCGMSARAGQRPTR